MRATWLLAAAAIAVAAPARADDGELPTIDSVHPAAIRVDGGCARIDRISLDVHAAGVSWLTLESRTFTCDRAELGLDVPAGTRIIGMAVSSGGSRSWSKARPMHEAIAAAHSVFGASLLAWDSTSAEQDHVRIEVNATSRIEIALELPYLARLEIDPMAHLVKQIAATVDGQPRVEWRWQAKTVALDLSGIAGHVTRDAYPHADADTWLVTGAPGTDEPEIERRFASPPERWGGAHHIRKLIRRNRERITYCYERVAQWQGGIAGDVMLHIMFGADGKVRAVQSDSALPREISACVEGVVASLELGDIDTPMLVNYPITFRMSE